MDFITKASSLNLDTPIEEIKNNLVYGGNMKYKLFLLISIFLILLTSCEIKNPNMENTNEVVIIDFGEETRGMTYFPENNPFIDTEYGTKNDNNNKLQYGVELYGSVMRSLPVIPGIKTVSKNDFISAIKDKTPYAYGVPLEVKDAQITQDGVYILYETKEEDRSFGQIEYYYSIKENKFSYREIISPLLKDTACDSIIIFELLDVPVEKTKDGLSFKVGELYNNGSKFNFYNIALTYYFGIYTSIPDKSSEIFFTELNMHMHYNNGDVNSSSFSSKMYERVPLKKELDLSNRRDTLNIDETKIFLRDFFDSPILEEKVEYKTLADFDKTEFEKKDFVAKTANGITNRKVISYPSSFNLKEKKAATIFKNETCAYNMNSDFSEDVIVNSFKDCGYKIEKVTDADSDEWREMVLDNFILSLMTKMDLPKDVIDSRRELLKDCYLKN